MVRSVEAIQADLDKVDGRSKEARSLRAELSIAQEATPGSQPAGGGATLPSARPKAPSQPKPAPGDQIEIPDVHPVQLAFAQSMLGAYIDRFGASTAHLASVTNSSRPFWDAFIRFAKVEDHGGLAADRDRYKAEARANKERAAEQHREIEILKKRLQELESRLRVHMRPV